MRSRNQLKQQAQKVEEARMKERLWTTRIVRIIMLISLLTVLIVSMLGYRYVKTALKPVDPSNHQEVEVTIPFDSSKRSIAELLEDAGIIRNADIFHLFLRTQGTRGLQAGHYQLSPSMNAQQVLERLEEGGEPIFVDADTTLTVVEGATVEQIAELVDENTAISKEEFIQTVQSKETMNRLVAKFPTLLQGLTEIEGLKYSLEGYLYPATYDYFAGMSAYELIEQMVESANLTYQQLVEDLYNTELTYHQILTLASIIEREAITAEDRKLVSGVFYNRMAIEMPLQSDITILYALGEHKELVTYDDLEVDSPYNTYQHIGLPPGPMNSPSYSAITAAIYPTYSDYYYFVADIDTQEVYFSQTQEEHDLLVEQYVNNRDTQEETTDESLESEDTQENQQ